MKSSFPIAPHPTVVSHLFSLKHPDLPQAARYFSSTVPKLGSRHYEKLFQVSRELAVQERRHPSATGPQLYSRMQAAVTSALGSGGFDSLDICSLCLLVLMEATQDADKDLEEIMAETKAQTSAKQALRDLINLVGRDVAQNAAQTPAQGPPQSPFRQSAIRFPRRW